MNISDAALFRAIDARKPTLFLDEVDAIFNPKARERGTKDDLRALLNAGYRRGQVVYRMGGGNHTTLESFDGVRREGARRPRLAAADACEPLHADRVQAAPAGRARRGLLPGGRRRRGGRLRDRLEAWAEAASRRCATARPARDRRAARPHERGLAAAARDRRARRRGVGRTSATGGASRSRRRADDEASLGLLLLEDIRTVFDEREAERIATTDLIVALARLRGVALGRMVARPKTDEPTQKRPRRLAQLLRPFGDPLDDGRDERHERRATSARTSSTPGSGSCPRRALGRQARQA